jgi:hypothetical protein
MSAAATAARRDLYQLRITGDGIRPVPIGGVLHAPGTAYRTAALAQVVHLMRNALAEPLDACTALDGALGVALQRAIPRPAC